VLYKILFLIKKTIYLNASIYITICDVIHLHVFRNRFVHMLFLCNFLSQRSVAHTVCVLYVYTYMCKGSDAYIAFNCCCFFLSINTLYIIMTVNLFSNEYTCNVIYLYKCIMFNMHNMHNEEVVVVILSLRKPILKTYWINPAALKCCLWRSCIPCTFIYVHVLDKCNSTNERKVL